MNVKRSVVYGLMVLLVIGLNVSCSLKIKGFQVICMAEKCSRTPCLYDDDNTRPEIYAVPLKRPGLPNLFKVSDALYRGAQPRPAGIGELKKLGIKTIVDLTRESKDKKLIKGYDFVYHSIPMTATTPREDLFLKFLEITANPDNHPVFVHCVHGADRTGAAVALYRIKLEGWGVEDAIAEMVLGCTRFHRKYASILPQFIINFQGKR